jgi:arylsulfatase A-like enzyme
MCNDRGILHIPVILAGPGIKPQIADRPICPEDIVPSAASYLGISAPSGTSGIILEGNVKMDK